MLHTYATNHLFIIVGLHNILVNSSVMYGHHMYELYNFFSKKNSYERGHNIPEKKLARSVLPSNIMDLHICPYTVKSPLTHNDNIGENVKLPLAIHTDHYPPCAATITPTGVYYLVGLFC